jgi:hypothetical protein
VARELEAVCVEPAFAGGVLGPLVIAVWRGAPTVEAIARAADHLAAWAAAAERPWAYLAVVEATSPAPTADVREHIERVLGTCGPSALCALIEGRPAWLTTVLDAGEHILRPQRTKWRAKMSVDLRELTTWLVRTGLPGRVAESDRPAIENAVALLRARLPPSA